MIIELKLKNWTSFRDETTFSLAATDERRLKARIPRIRKNPALSVLPVSVLYGGNASGKTNLFSLLAFLQGIIVAPLHDEGKEIPLDVFLLDSESQKMPTEITLSFLSADEKIYTFELSLTRKEILKESLSVVKRQGEVKIFTRQNGHVELIDRRLQKDKDAIAFAQIIQRNQSFLGIAGNKVKSLNSAYRWFRNQLSLINTRSLFQGFWDMFVSAPSDIEHLSQILKQLDTGICRLELEDSTFAALPANMFSESELNSRLNNGEVVELNIRGLRYIVRKDDGKVSVKKMVSYHQNAEGKQVKFELSNESEGSLRLLDILPAFIDLEKNDLRKVYVIDELDRSWHYALSQRLLGIYLSHCSPESRSQLLFSTQDLMLMDQDIFRRDEIWIVERNTGGVSTLFPLSAFDIRYDKDIRKLYLQGAIGGIPQMTAFGSLARDKEV